MDKVRIGFIGCGAHATSNIYPSLRFAPIELVCVCDLDVKKAERNAKHFGAERVYTNYLEMFEKEKLDAIFIVTGPKYHPQLSIEAMQAGFHVFVEKPPAENLEEVEKMCKVSKETGKFLMVAFMKRFATGYVMAKEIIRRPQFGKPLMIYSKYRSPVYPDEYKCLLDYSIHHLDLFRHFMGEVDQICVEKTRHENRVGFAVTMKFKNLAVGLMNLGSLQSGDNLCEFLEITGEGEQITVDNVVNVTYARRHNFGWIREKQELYLSTDAITWKPNNAYPTDLNSSLYHQGYFGEVKHFAESIINNHQPLTNIFDTYKTMKLVKILYETEGEIVKVDHEEGKE